MFFIPINRNIKHLNKLDKQLDACIFSLIFNCLLYTSDVYKRQQQGNYQGVPPTLQDFREELVKQDEPEAKEIALAIELFTDCLLYTSRCV